MMNEDGMFEKKETNRKTNCNGSLEKKGKMSIFSRSSKMSTRYSSRASHIMAN